MYNKFKPLLAETAELDKLVFPVYASPKLDGIRALVLNGKLVSRNLKPIPNKFVRECVEKYAELLEGFDGELIVGDNTDPKCFNTTSSAIMSFDGEPDFRFYVFDKVMQGVMYHNRLKELTKNFSKLPNFVSLVMQSKVNNIEALNDYEEHRVGQGFEGVMVRSPEGRYKFGRSTIKEGILLKVKRFADAEAVIIDFVERMHNANEATVDALGHTERSSHKANMIGRGDLGALVVKCKEFDGEFNIGSGFDDFMRKDIWDNREFYKNKLVKFKYQPAGMKDVPRFPTFNEFIGFRHEDDL